MGMPIDGHIKLQDRADPTAFSSPDYESILGYNPFPFEHRLHAEWERRRETAASDAAQLCARLQAEFLERVQAEPARRWWWALLQRDLALCQGILDIRARR